MTISGYPACTHLTFQISLLIFEGVQLLRILNDDRLLLLHVGLELGVLALERGDPSVCFPHQGLHVLEAPLRVPGGALFPLGRVRRRRRRGRPVGAVVHRRPHRRARRSRGGRRPPVGCVNRARTSTFPDHLSKTERIAREEVSYLICCHHRHDLQSSRFQVGGSWVEEMEEQDKLLECAHFD